MYRVIIVVSETQTVVRKGFTTSSSAAEFLSKYVEPLILEGRTHDMPIISAQIIAY